MTERTNEAAEHRPIHQRQGDTHGYWCSCGYPSCDLDGHAKHVAEVMTPAHPNPEPPTGLFLTLAPNDIDPELGAEVVPATTGDGPRAQANAAFIAAANPSAVLALLDRVEAAEGAVERVRALAEFWVEADGEPATDRDLTVLNVTNRHGRELTAALDPS